jgi:poly(3-hydroxyalkanoate) depolymerase
MTTATEHIINVEGQDLRVAVRRGQAGATPLLIINGIGASLELLQPFVDALDPARSGDVIRFDVPGVGGSPMPRRPYRFSGLCRLIAAMLSALGYGQVDVLGISWGGGVAQQFAVAQRSRCRRLVLVSTGTGATMVPAKPSVLLQMAKRQRYVDNGHMARVVPDLYGGSARAEPEQVSQGTHDNNRLGPSRGYRYQLAASFAWSSAPFLPLLRQPTLIMSGDDDPIIRLSNARMMHRLIRGSRLHIFHGGHLGLVAEAAELAPLVQDFLAAEPSPGRPEH